MSAPDNDAGATLPANAVRGEFSLPLGGKVYVLRPSYEAIVAIEEQTGKGLLQLFNDAAGAALTLRETGIVVSEFIRAQGRAVDDALMAAVDATRIAKLIMEAETGPAGAMGTVGPILGSVACGDYTASGEPKTVEDRPQGTE